MPKYVALTYTADVDWTSPEYSEEMKDYQEFGEAAAAVIRGGDALYPTATATTVRVNGGKGGDVLTSDGPYAETKEALTGFYLLECADLDEAVAMAAKIPAAWAGAVEVRPIIEFRASMGAGDAVARLVREEGTRVLATLVRVTGSVDLAEDAAQDAILRALETWPGTVCRTTRVAGCWSPRSGGPSTSSAARCGGRARKPRRTMTSRQIRAGPPEVVRDDLLRLVFTCCHPCLALDAQVALALRTLGGLSTAEVARGLLVPEATMAKRLTRAKQKITQAGIPYRVPAPRTCPIGWPGSPRPCI